jgi:ribosomal protein L19E
LLSRDTGRAWKVRDIAEALWIENIKSLRTSLDEFARTGVLKKDPHTSCYYVGERGEAADGFF